MQIQNNRTQVYRQPIPNYNTLVNVAPNIRQVPRLAIGGAMIGRIQFAKSGCSSCGK
jgi:hypothetical protein